MAERQTPQNWSNATTSVFESCNNVLMGVRGMTIATLVEHTQQRMPLRFSSQRNIVDKWHCSLIPYVVAFLIKMKKLFAYYLVQPIDLYVYQVNSSKYQGVVDLEKWEFYDTFLLLSCRFCLTLWPLRNSHLPFQLLVIVITYKYLYHKLEWHSLTSPMMLVIHPHTFDYLLSLTWRVPLTSTSLSCQPTSIANRVSELVPTPWCEEGLFLTRSSLPLRIPKK